MKYKIFIYIFCIGNVESFLEKNFFKRLNIACKYNTNRLKKLIDIEKSNFENKITEIEFDREYIQNFSSDSSEELLDLLKDNTIFLFEINKEYLYFISLIISQIFNFTINDAINTKNKEEAARLIIKNIIVPMIIHDVIRLLFNLLKEIINFN